MSEQPLAVEVRGVTRVFPGHVNALAGVDLTVAYGETVAITGPSGCGKSTSPPPPGRHRFPLLGFGHRGRSRSGADP